MCESNEQAREHANEEARSLLTAHISSLISIVSESILDSSAFMPVTLGEVVATPCATNTEETEEESSGMVPNLDVPVRLGPKIFPCSYDGEREVRVVLLCSKLKV